MQRQALNLLPQVQGVSILTRPPGRVQPVRAVGVAVREVVSILTRPEGRVQRHRDGEDDEIHARVSILTRPEGRVQPESGMYSARCSMFQSSPGQKAGCNQPERERRRGNECVSILTRPEGRVQRVGGERCGGDARGVSILTRPEGRVQRPLPVRLHLQLRVSILTRPEGRVQPPMNVDMINLALFQSSPGQKAGCNGPQPQLEPLPGIVSILTRPEGRVQHQQRDENRAQENVSILTRPSGRVQPVGPHWHRRGLATVSILTRPSGRVQLRYRYV